MDGRAGESKRRAAILGGLALLLAGALLAGVLVGPTPLEPRQVLAGLLARPPADAGADQAPPPGMAIGSGTADQAEAAAWAVIVREIRLPRVLLAALVGMALAEAGVALQGLFRNPLADPYVAGVSAGAALGATVAFALRGLSPARMDLPVPLLAFAGALGTAELVWRLARRGEGAPVHLLLLAGLAVSALFSAAISVLMVVGQRQLGEVVFWLMGGLAGRGWNHVAAAFPAAALGTALVAPRRRELDLLLFGEEEARYLGVEVALVQRRLQLGASLLAAAAVAVSGLVGFVGLVVPHLCRLLVGPDHRALLPASLLAGGALTVLADLVARTAFAPVEVPLGAVTALVGGPFFLFLLWRSGRGHAYLG